MTALAPGSAPVLRQDDAGIIRLTLNQPQTRNALSPELVETMIEALACAFADAPQGLIIDGAGPAFCGGLDLSDLETRSEGDLFHLIVRIEIMLQMVWNAPCRTLALAQRAAMGAGADLLVACQNRIAAPKTRLAFPGVGFGIFLGTRRLADRIGAQPARQVLIAGVPIDAQKAQTLGLIETCMEQDAWPDFITQWCEQTRGLDPHVAANLGRMTNASHDAADLEALVRSAARPGLKKRILTYVEKNRAARQSKEKGNTA